MASDYIGFDYGTSNCAVGIMNNGQPEILSLGEHGRFIPSTFVCTSRDIISHWLYQQLPAAEQAQFKTERSLALQKRPKMPYENLNLTVFQPIYLLASEHLLVT